MFIAPITGPIYSPVVPLSSVAQTFRAFRTQAVAALATKAVKDTVTISSNASFTREEFAETRDQSVTEARGGDVAAQAILARWAAAHTVVLR